MRASQLIEALLRLPGDPEILWHPGDYDASLGCDIAYGDPTIEMIDGAEGGCVQIKLADE